MFGYDRPTYTYLIRYGVDNGMKPLNTKRTDLSICILLGKYWMPIHLPAEFSSNLDQTHLPVPFYLPWRPWLACSGLFDYDWSWSLQVDFEGQFWEAVV